MVDTGTVDIALQDYTIHVGSELQVIQSYLESASKVVVLVDENTAAHCLPLLDPYLDPSRLVIRIPSGERHKTIDTCQHIWDQLFELKADRKSLMINLGGGVIGDMGGFAASTFMRGMDFVQVPTTLLAQVDASIGGKIGIDFRDIKNAVGLFCNPRAVLIDPRFLRTLPHREVRSGFAEIIKHGLIKDNALWRRIVDIKDLAPVDWADLILPALAIKRQVVEQDPLEKGHRKTLNFGHTIGHAIESVMLHGEQPLLHGEAIAIGMIAESYLSSTLGSLPPAQLTSISEYILSIFPKAPIDLSLFADIMQKMRLDKKNEADSINFTFLDRIGHAIINQRASDEAIRAAIQHYQNL